MAFTTSKMTVAAASTVSKTTSTSTTVCTLLLLLCVVSVQGFTAVPAVGGSMPSAATMANDHSGSICNSHSHSNTRLYDTEIPDGLQPFQSQHVLLGFELDFVFFPHGGFSATEVITMCMDGLQSNNRPYKDAGLETCWNFSNDLLRASQGGSLDTFIEHTAVPAFDTMLEADGWEIKSVGPLVPRTRTRGAMKSVVVDITPKNGKAKRQFVFTMQQERRPPLQDCWLIQGCTAKDKLFEQTL